MRSRIPAVEVAAFISFGRSTDKLTLFVVLAAVTLAGSVEIVRGQSVLDGFDPKPNAPVHVVVVQPDGKILLGGEFTTLSPNGGVAVSRNHIARLNPNGTLDAFNPNSSDDVYAIAVQSDGKILAGGRFSGASSIGGQARNHIARLDGTTGLADAFDPNADGNVLSIALQEDGSILAAGDFNNIGGQIRRGIGRLDTTIGIADSFDPHSNNTIASISIEPDGKILVGGYFSTIGGQTRHSIARLDTTTGLADPFDPNANDAVVSIAVQADGKILVGGRFNGTGSIGGQTRNYIARLDPLTGLADPFDPGADDNVVSVALQPDGKILASGAFNFIGG